MLTPSSDCASSPSAMRYDQQQPSDNRPKLFMAPPMQPPYGHYLPHGIPHHTPLKYENGAAPYLPPSMPDYQAPPNDTPSSAKRSREELNMKEKQRMFKLNERISQLRELLDAAGMQTKKNKQSVLDNTAHFVEKLQTDLKVAQQKAARAEKQAESFRALAPRGDKVLRRAFESSSTPRLVVDLQCHTLAFNAAFVKHTGLAEPTLKKKKTLRQFVCVDQEKLDKIVDKIRDTKKTVGVLVKAYAAGGKTVAVNLIAAVVMDDSGEAVNVEFSLIPVDVQQQRPQQASTKRRKVDVKSDEKQMPGKDPTTGGDKHADESAIYVHL